MSDRSASEADAVTPGERPGVDGPSSDASQDGQSSARSGGAGTGDAAASSAAGLPSASIPKGGVLKLGVHLSSNGAAASTFGVKLPAHSPEKVGRIITWINANGGIGGRRVVPVYHTSDPLKGSFDQQAQDACTSLTQDHKVDYAIGAAQLYRDSLPACFAKNRTPFVWDVFYTSQRSVVPAEYLYRPAQPHADRLGFVVDGLVKHGFFKNARIGLIRYDSPKEKTVADRVFKPALTAHGLKLAAEAAIREPESAAQAGDSAAELSNVALRFRQQQISHVLFVPSGGAIPLLFLAAAESQHYRPRYGLSSQDAPYFVRDSVPASQLEGAVGVGWSPIVDLGPTNRDAQRFSAGSRLCVSIAIKAGYGPEEAPMSFCNMLFFLKAALAGTGGNTVDALRNAVPSATGFDSVLTYGASFAPGLHDGMSKARIFTWDGDWKYVGAPYAVGR